MKRIIDGKLYNTETATLICDTSNGLPRSDFQAEDSALYVTKKEAYFVAGSGGPSTRFARKIRNGRSDGSGIIPLTRAEAREECERQCRTDEDADLIQEFFGDIIEAA
jgi:hypothetical protein